MSGPPEEVGPRQGCHALAEGTDTHINATTTVDVDKLDYTRPQALSSSQRVFWPVYEYGQKLLEKAGIAAADLHPPGTPAWVALPDEDPAKLLACVLDSPHHTARVEAAQAALADASRVVSAAADWGAVGREIHRRTSFRANHPEAKRVLA